MSLMQTLANHYDLLPSPVREAYLLERVEHLNRALTGAMADVAALEHTVAELGRAHAAQLVAADQDTQTIMRLRRALEAEHESVLGLERLHLRFERRGRALVRQCARLRDARDAAAQPAPATSAAVSPERVDALHEEERVFLTFPESRQEPDGFDLPFTPNTPLRCPHCQTPHNSRGEPFTDFSLRMHVSRCIDNPQRARKRRSAPPLPVPTPESLSIATAPGSTGGTAAPLDAWDDALYHCPVCGGTAFAESITHNCCMKCAQGRRAAAPVAAVPVHA